MADCGLYVHVPFCTRKCGYCDFYTVPLAGRDAGGLVRALLVELKQRVNGGLRVSTIFVGGGTPTALSAAELGVLFGALGDLASVHGVSEFTVEANPGTVDEAKFAVLRSSGVDRLSLGAQSWRVSELSVLDREHDPDAIGRTVSLARAAGIARINVDLMFGIPGQTLSSWSESLDRTLGLGVDHVSCYGLTYEPGTRLTERLGDGEISRCAERLETAMYEHAVDRLPAAGLEQYEISSFARSGERCQHNMTYWRSGPYVAVGPSACGYVEGERYRNVSDISAYIRGIEERGRAVVESERVTGVTLAGEMILMQLRLCEGLDVHRFVRATGIDPHEALRIGLARYGDMGLVSVSKERLWLTRRGRLVADTIIGDFYAAVHGAVEAAPAAAAVVGAPGSAGSARSPVLGSLSQTAGLSAGGGNA